MVPQFFFSTTPTISQNSSIKLKDFESLKFPIEASTMKKIVIKVNMNEPPSIFYCFGPQSSHSKALRLAAGFPGVESVALAGDRDKIEVTGELVDPVKLTTLLRKKVGSAEIESVGEAKKEKKKDDAKPIQWWYPPQEVVYVHPETGWW